nr:NADH dehydrogenase subunit 2 [Scopeloberyx opisthopterus]
MSPYVLTALMFSLAWGTTITFASSHWLLAWMGLEMNTLAILPLMAQNHHPRAVEATTKYFLAQATAAAVILFASLTNAWLTGQWDIQQTAHPLPLTMITLALAFKIGLAPLHSWLPEVLQGLDLTTGLILSTWQKLAPFALIVQVQPYNQTTIISLGLISILVGGYGGLNQTQLRKILAYSSIAHLGWMTLVVQFNPSLTMLALLTYFLMTFSAFQTFKLGSSTNINTLSTSWALSPLLAALASLVFLALGGLPPLVGFAPKWLILHQLTMHGLAPTATAAALLSLLSLYFYLRLSYAAALTISPNTLTNTVPWRLPTLQRTLPLATATMATIAFLPLTPTAIALLAP